MGAYRVVDDRFMAPAYTSCKSTVELTGVAAPPLHRSPAWLRSATRAPGVRPQDGLRGGSRVDPATMALPPDRPACAWW